MNVETLQILEPGLLTTVQDKGRYGYQRFGVPVAGAMDVFAVRAANILVGNEDGAAALEMTVVGPRTEFLVDTCIALSGADLAPILDGEPVPMWQTIEASKGSVLSFGGTRDGMRSYLAVPGGIDVPVVMSSRSTYLKGGFGGLEGRALKAGDVLRTLPVASPTRPVIQGIPPDLEPPPYGHQHKIRVVMGPQDKRFTDNGVASFLGSDYTVSVRSDRMGYRLEGPAIEHASGADIVSDGSALGSVQVPGDGQPIILLADRGTTGGYTKIATVISADIGRLAQAMPGDALTFKAATLEEAHVLLREQEAVLGAIGPISTPAESIALPLVSVSVEGEAVEVVDEAGSPIAVADAGGEPSRSQRHSIRATVGGRTYEFEVDVRRGTPR